MEQLLPIVIAIIFFGYRQYKKSIENNNDQKVTSPSNSEDQYQAGTQHDSLNDFISSFMGAEEDELKQPAYSDKFEEPSREDYSYSYNNEIVPKEKDEKDEEIEVNLNATKDLQDDNYQESMGKDAVIPEFDLRQAVVYDAVLNPPYINN